MSEVCLGQLTDTFSLDIAKSSMSPEEISTDGNDKSCSDDHVAFLRRAFVA
jgi:hypothetical protein